MIQTNLFSEQIQQQNQINKLTTVKNLLLASAIISAIFSVPGLGYSIGLILQIPMIAFLILSIFTLVFARKAHRSVIGSTLSIIANTLSFLTFFILIYALTLPDYSSANEAASNLYIIVALITWAVYIATTIVLFIEFNAVNKAITELRYHGVQQYTLHQSTLHFQQTPLTTPYQVPQMAQPIPQPHNTHTENPFIIQQEVITTTQPNAYQEQLQSHTPNTSLQSNPFLAETEEMTTVHPTLIQEQLQPHIPNTPIQSNPFLAETVVENLDLFIDHK